MQKSMAFARQGRLWVMVHGAEDVTDADWDAYIRALGKVSERERTIVFTDGPSPNAKQRRILNDVLQGITLKSAIISESAAVRGSVAALSLFNRGIRAFALAELEQAFAYLALDAADEAFVKESLKTLRLQVR